MIIWILTPTVLLILAVLIPVAYVLVRYVPIIERNAFDVPRLAPPAENKPPKSINVRQVLIPHDTRYAIEAQYIRGNKKSRKLVVFCHETGADLNSWYKHAYFLPEDGVDVLTFNFRLKDIKSGKAKEQTNYQWPSKQEVQCLERVLSWVAVERKNYEVALFGVSKGATIAAAAAPSPMIKSVMLDGAFSTQMTLERYMKKWVNIYVTPRQAAVGVPDWIIFSLAKITLIYASFKNRLRFFSVEKFMTQLKKPVFLIHAGKDFYVGRDHIERLRLLARGFVDLWVAEKAGHSDAVSRYPHEYKSKIVGFINKTLD